MKYSKSEFDYTLEKAFTETQAVFSFNGNFQGSLVTWHVTLHSIDPSQQSPDSKNPQPSQLIKISPDPKRSDHFHAVIRLNLVKLTTADILKTMVMLRQYKNLSIGVHTWSTGM